MIIYDLKNKAECSLPENSAAALGNFDGVHIGHRRLFDALGHDRPRAVFTFSDLRRPGDRSVLCEVDERLELIAQCGVSYAVLVPFEEVRGLSPEQFCDMLCGSLKISRAVCGFNFTFGAGGRGNADTLCRLMEERSAEAVVVPPVTLGGETVSSTAIRRLLLEGRPERAAEMLGRNHFVRFPVIHGRELGRTIGVPTINQRFPENALVPRYGVYSARVRLGERFYPGVCNVGVRPTVSGKDENEPFAETHIIGFSGWLYGESVRVEFIRYLRPEIKFPSIDELKAQILKDIGSAKEDLT